jgi:glycerophosphoryl diester phosphodiesterase
VVSVAVQAHRGSPDHAAGIRQNTLEAFERARALGADGVELDVRLTRDGAMAVHHDAAVPGLGPICDLSAGELPPYVPLLPEVLEACTGMTVNIEIKNLPGEPGYDGDERLAAAVADLVVGRRLASSVVGRLRSPAVLVSSFWPQTLEAVHRAAPDISTGLLVAHWFDPAGCVLAAVGLGCSAVHPHLTLVDDALVGEAHAAGLTVAAWTVDDPDGLDALVATGVDTVITDDVPMAVSALRGP